MIYDIIKFHELSVMVSWFCKPGMAYFSGEDVQNLQNLSLDNEPVFEIRFIRTKIDDLNDTGESLVIKQSLLVQGRALKFIFPYRILLLASYAHKAVSRVTE